MGVNEILKLMSSYCHLTDASRCDEVAALFAEQGVLEVPIMNAAVSGRENIAKFIAKNADPKTFSMHCIVNPIIDADASFADGSFDLFSIHLRDKPEIAAMGRCIAKFVCENARWKISWLQINIHSAATI